MGKFVCIAIIITTIVGCCPATKVVKKNGFLIVQLPNLFENKGAIVPKDYQTASEALYFGRFTPCSEDIIGGEYILKANLSRLCKSSSDDSSSCVKDLSSDYRNYNRFYIGYINKQNQKLLMIYLFNYSSFEAKKRFCGWENDYSFGAGEFWEKNTWTAFINLETGQIE